MAQALPNLPSKIGVTASLNLSYKLPTFADQFVVLRSRLSPDPAKRPSGRKVWVEGRLETINGQVLVEAELSFFFFRSRPTPCQICDRC